MSLNHITVMGRIGKDIELRRTNSGVSVTSFPLAVDRDFKNADGSTDTDWIDIICWKGTAEFAAKFFGKGRTAIVDGRLQMREWVDRDGNKRKNAEIIAEHLYFGDSRPATGGGDVFGHSDGVFVPADDGDLPF